MKHVAFKLMTVACLFTATIAFGSQSNIDPDNLTKALREQIISLIDKPDLKDSGVESEEAATLTFLVNEKNEIVVLTVDTESRYIDSYLKARLNYKKLLITKIEKGTYTMKIIFRNDELR